MNEKQKLLISDSLPGRFFGVSDRMALYRSVITSLLGIMFVPFYIKYKRRMREEKQEADVMA